MDELAQSMEAKDCTLDVVEATLANFRLELVPENPLDTQSSGDGRRNASRAAASIPFLEMIVASSCELPHVARYTVPLVLASLEGLICWSGIALDLALPYDQPQRANRTLSYA